MRDVLWELFHGNISPFEQFYPNTKEMQELAEFITQDYEYLTEKLAAEEKEKFERYEKNVIELEGLTNEALFSYAFSLGVRLAVACFSKEPPL